MGTMRGSAPPARSPILQPLPRSSTVRAGLGAGRAGCGQAQGSPHLPVRSSESRGPAFPRAAIGEGSLPPRAARRGPNASVSTWQSIFKSQAAGPRKGNYPGQPRAPANGNGAAFPWDVASAPTCPFAPRDGGSSARWAEFGLISFLRGGCLRFGVRAGTHWSISAPRTSLRTHPQPSATHSPTWDLLPKQVRVRGGSHPGDEGQKAEIISPSRDVSCEQRQRRGTTPHLCQTPLLEDSHYQRTS